MIKGQTVALVLFLPSQSNGQVGGEGSHTAQSSGRGRTGSSYPHKTDSAALPSGGRGGQSP